MPTYTWRCLRCGTPFEAVMGIREYCDNPPTYVCCGAEVPRTIEVVPGLAKFNALAGDRHYDGMRATDGTDIGTRAKHQAYMKAKGLTTADDYKETWKKAAEQRAATMQGQDTTRRTDIAQAIEKLSG